MKEKIKYEPFSNGTEFMAWTAQNCDRCVKASHLRKTIAGEEYTTFRCAVQKEIILAAAFPDEYVANELSTSVKSWIVRTSRKQGRNIPRIRSIRNYLMIRQ